MDAADAAVAVRLKGFLCTRVGAHHFHPRISVRGGIAPDGIPEEATRLGPISGADCELVPEFSGVNRLFPLNPVFCIYIVEEPFVVLLHRSHEGISDPYGDIGVTNRRTVPLDFAEIQDVWMGIRNRDHERPAASLLPNNARGEGVKFHE